LRFQTSETIAIRDAEMVLSALESCLREMSSQVERLGDRITLHGLGPSPRVKNYRDTTVLCVNAEEDRTVIVADVSFQASSLLGDVRQDEVVRSKLDEIFDQMREQLRTDRGQRPRVVQVAKEEVTPVVERVEEVSVPRSFETAEKSVVQEAVVAAPVAGMAEPVMQMRAQIISSPQEDGVRWGRIVGVIAAALVLLAAGYVLRGGEWRRSAAWAAGAVRRLEASGVSVPREGTATSAESGSDGAKAPVKADEAFYARETEDPKVWLGEWADAMRTRDPMAQASYYADRVERYMTTRDVSREEVAAKKREGIAGRRGLWTVKMEDVVVERRTASEVDVRLVKHFMEAPVPGEMAETRVRSRLRLRRVDGAWEIVREEDLPDAGIRAEG
jgi:hypothetical protein